LRIISIPTRALILSLTILVFSPPGASAQSKITSSASQQLNLQEYTAQLDHSLDVVVRSAHDPAALNALRMSLPAKWRVKVGDQDFSVETDWLTDDLARAEKDQSTSDPAMKDAQQKLTAYRDAARAMDRQAASQDLDRSRTKLNEILAAKEFQTVRAPSWFDALRARFYAWIGRQLEKLFGHIRSPKSIGNIVAWTVITLAALLLLLWAVRASIRGGSRPEMDLRGASKTGQDWPYWLRQARDAAARRDYRAAIHAAYWAAVARLEETNSLPEDRSRTPRESLRLIRKENAAYAPLSQLTRRFELVWYGYHSATDADWSDAMQQLETLGCLPSSTPAISGS
jgi:Domain of unknown function (DUF4129)